MSNLTCGDANDVYIPSPRKVSVYNETMICLLPNSAIWLGRGSSFYYWTITTEEALGEGDFYPSELDELISHFISPNDTTRYHTPHQVPHKLACWSSA